MIASRNVLSFGSVFSRNKIYKFNVSFCAVLLLTLEFNVNVRNMQN